MRFSVKYKQKTIICVLAAAALSMQSASVCASAVFSSGRQDPAGINVIIDTLENRKRISKYIYGINSVYGTEGVTASSVKQSGPELSSYNWETNYANLAAGGGYRNSNLLVSSASPIRWNEPALLSGILVDEARDNNIPSRYVTLQMMGKVAGDANGAVLQGDSTERWAEVRFGKGGNLTVLPDASDGRVYMDEYVSCLVNAYGYAAEGGINGYFLDSEPENWAENYAVLGLEPLTSKGLLSKSVSLAGAVKKIDPTAIVYGPSVGGMESFVNLKNPSDWEQYKENYSWFLDYYLDTMRAASEQSGTRLLDVLDLHYISEAKSVILEPIIGTDSDTANQERMQAVRVLWDSNYTENSPAAILYKQHTPIIPTVQASIRMYYPNTKLSFSEYNFGGGNHISGGIAEADALGIFGEQDVYMACLKPDRKDFGYQKSGINIYTNYDGNCSSYGNISVYTSNSGDNMSSVHASIRENDSSALKAIFINKSTDEEKNIFVSITSDAEFRSANIYSFDENSPEITLSDKLTGITENSFEYTMSPQTVYLFEFSTEDHPGTVTATQSSEEISDGSSVSSVTDAPEHADVSSMPAMIQTVPPETETITSISVIGIDDDGSEITQIVTETVTYPSGTESSQELLPPDEKEEKPVPEFVKITGISLVAAVILAMFAILLADGRSARKKRR